MNSNFTIEKSDHTLLKKETIQSIKCCDSLACYVYIQMLLQQGREDITFKVAADLLDERFVFGEGTAEECLEYLIELGVLS